MSIPSIQSLLKKYGLRPKKKLGQHFLSSRPTMEKIVHSLSARADDIVIEIGPGLGFMTALLAPLVRKVVAIDRDLPLLDVARAEFGGIENIEWVHADILDFDIGEIASRAESSGRVKVLGNLPYNISSPIIFWMLENRERISSAVVMLQKEVARRLTSGPGSRDYGILSVLVGARADCRRLFDVKAANFIPPPEVTSTVVRIEFQDHGGDDADDAWFRSVVKAAFGKRRKTLRNALIGARALMLTAGDIDGALERCNIDGARRPETLGVEEFRAIASCLDRL